MHKPYSVTSITLSFKHYDVESTFFKRDGSLWCALRPGRSKLTDYPITYTLVLLRRCNNT